MNCRALAPTRPSMPSASQRLERITDLAGELLSALEREGVRTAIRTQAIEIEMVARLGAAHERRRELGATINEGASHAR